MVVILLVPSIICYYLAKSKGRNPWLAAFFGLAWFPVIIYAFMDPKDKIMFTLKDNVKSDFNECDRCKEIFFGKDCPSCGSTESNNMTVGEFKTVLYD